MGQKNSVRAMPEKPKIEAVASTEMVDNDGEPCTVIFYKEKGYKGRQFAVKVKNSKTSEVSVPKVRFKPASVKFEGKCDAGFGFRGYSKVDYTGKTMDFTPDGDYAELSGDFGKIKSMQSIRAAKAIATAEVAVGVAEKDPNNPVKVKAAVKATAKAEVETAKVTDGNTTGSDISGASI
tara:strand:- start:90 stop:626 length:537 start_codon:yes stop_codon:yes gene_type:complete